MIFQRAIAKLTDLLRRQLLWRSGNPPAKL